ncbi:MAG: hypothetical protein IE929_13190, partial [Rhizorhabdus sp.]|nr:hypothetical protein [Rhizorhabdus sp.]
MGAISMASGRRPAWAAAWTIMAALLALIGLLALRIGGDLPAGLVDSQAAAVSLSQG